MNISPDMKRAGVLTTSFLHEMFEAGVEGRSKSWPKKHKDKVLAIVTKFAKILNTESDEVQDSFTLTMIATWRKDINHWAAYDMPTPDHMEYARSMDSWAANFILNCLPGDKRAEYNKKFVELGGDLAAQKMSQKISTGDFTPTAYENGEEVPNEL